MKIHFASAERPRLVAKALRKALKNRSVDLTLSRCQEAVARMYGHASWHDLTKSIGAAPQSPDDIDVAPEEVAARAAQYAAVLRDIGILDGEAVVAEIKPSARSAGRAGIPRLLVEAFEIDGEGERVRSLGMQDLTVVVTDRMVPHERSIPARLSKPLYLQTISNGLSEEARGLGVDRRLALPGFHEIYDRFVAAVGGLDAFHAFKKRLDDIRHADSTIKEAERELRLVEKATFSTKFGDYGMLYSEHLLREFNSDLTDMFDEWGFELFTRDRPQPARYGSPEWEAWQADYTAFIESNAPPFVFGTTEYPWKGVEPSQIRTAHEEEGGRPDLEAILENEMSDHHEDAFEQIVDEKGLYAIVDEWLPHAGKGTAEDLLLEEKIATWNAKQRITTYYADEKVILPSFEGKTKEDAIAWCRLKVEEAKARRKELDCWTAPEPAPQGEKDAPRPV